ncbi:Uncharacterized protein Rs2_49582 [Raphanus sativus]|nr:Uncharacterized protein Rs2_49582 [Raphanus sativus]
MIKDYDKALTLDGSYLDGLRLTVKMAIKREEYYVFTNHKGCKRCGIALSANLKKQWSEQFYSRNRLSSQMTCVPEKETPEEKVFECLYESKEAFIEHKRSIFVRGFDCSFPRDEIRSTLIKHFSSCGEVCEVAIPFHCKTGSPMGFAFINMVKDEEKALTLDGSYLGGMRLEVTMGINRSEYHGYTGRLGCNRCRRVLLKRRMEDFYSFPTIPIPSPEINRSRASQSLTTKIKK